MVDLELYGGRRGFFEHIRARVQYSFGIYREVRELEWTAVKRLAFVCKGNICRSPYACAKARSLGVPAISFGLDAVDGAPADAAATRKALLRGIDLSAHHSMRMEPSNLVDGDLLIAFEPRQVAEVRRRCGEQPPASLLGIWSRSPRPHIYDPYGGGDRYFQECFSVIDENIAKLVEQMVAGGAPAVRDVAAEPLCESIEHGSHCGRTLI